LLGFGPESVPWCDEKPEQSETAVVPHRNRESVQYAWAGNQIVFAGDYRNTDPRTRPRVTCMATGARLLIHAGTRLRPHMALYPRATGSEPKPETARHINSIGHLCRASQGAQQLTVEVACAGAPDQNGYVRPCGRRISFIAARDWTNVIVEKMLDRRRPDAMLEWNGRPLVLFEFFATHAVDWLKERDLSQLDAPTVEVVADPRLYEGASAWSPRIPLPGRRVIPGAMAPRCPDHKVAYRVHCVDLFGISDLLFFKLADVYPLMGTPWRSLFRLDAVPEGSDGDSRWALRQDGRVVFEVVMPSWWSAKAIIDTAFEHAIAALRRNQRAIVITSVRWVTYTELPFFSPVCFYDTTRWPLAKPPRRQRVSR
jgi:hypothetical protein